jgi:hypothetical protein
MSWAIQVHELLKFARSGRNVELNGRGEPIVYWSQTLDSWIAFSFVPQ